MYVCVATRTRMRQVLKPSARAKDPFTHDAYLHGTDRKQKRGVLRLSSDAYKQGCWVPISLENGEDAELEQKVVAKAKGRAHGKRPAPPQSPSERVGKRVRTPVDQFSNYVQSPRT